MFYTVTCHLKFDEAIAILAGDAMIPLAFEIMANNIRLVEIANQCELDLLAQAITLLERLETPGRDLREKTLPIMPNRYLTRT